MIRFLINLIFIVLFLILSIPYLGLEWILGRYNKQASDLRQLRVIQTVFKIALRISGVKLTVIGEENVPTDETVLYIGNHRSIFDVVITYARCPRLTGYISKDSMEKIPLFSWWMKRLHCLFLNREDIKEGLKTILAGIEHIKTGISVCIFPEGTRNKNPEGLLPFKEGSLKIAEKTGCAIVPMALTGTADIFENHLPRIKPTAVTLEYGKPIYPGSLDKETKKHLGAYCQNIIAEMLEKNTKKDVVR